MTLDLVSIVILVAVASLSSVAGYWVRIVQKLEEKRDQIYLTALPSIYSKTIAFKDALTLFQKGGNIDQLASSLSETSKDLSETIFSGDILIFEVKLHDELFKFHQDAGNLQAIVKEILDIEVPEQKKEKANDLRLAFSGSEEFSIGMNLTTNPKDVFTQAVNISKGIKKELERYHSYSWKLTVIILVLGALVALIEIIKGYFSP